MEINHNTQNEPVNSLYDYCASIVSKVNPKWTALGALTTFCYPISHGSVAVARAMEWIKPGLSTFEQIQPLASRFTEIINLSCLKSFNSKAVCLITDPLTNPEKAVIDLVRIIESECPVKEYIQQVNQYYWKAEQISSVAEFRYYQGINNFFIGIQAPMQEEILFRCIIQKGLLKGIPLLALQKSNPKQECIVDSLSIKVLRILITSGLFSAFHLQNEGLISDSALEGQLVHTFVLGLFLSTITELEPGFLGITLVVMIHMFYNFIALSDECTINL